MPFSSRANLCTTKFLGPHYAPINSSELMVAGRCKILWSLCVIWMIKELWATAPTTGWIDSKLHSIFGQWHAPVDVPSHETDYDCKEPSKNLRSRSTTRSRSFHSTTQSGNDVKDQLARWVVLVVRSFKLAFTFGCVLIQVHTHLRNIVGIVVVVVVAIAFAGDAIWGYEEFRWWEKCLCAWLRSPKILP